MKTIFGPVVPSQNRKARSASKVRGACSITLLLAMLGAGALVLAVLSAHRTSVGVGSVALCLFLLIGTGVLPHALASRLQRPFPTKKPAEATFGSSVCIIVLGEGSVFHPNTQERTPSWIAGSRIVTTAALHRAALARGVSSRIVIAGERTRSEPDTEDQGPYTRALTDLGVSHSDMVRESDGLNTYDHAKNIATIMKVHPAETIYLVTSALHLKRALLYFGAFGLRPIPFPSDYIHVPRLVIPLGYNFAVADIALHQYIGILRFHVYERLGLNRRSSRPEIN